MWAWIQHLYTHDIYEVLQSNILPTNRVPLIPIHGAQSHKRVCSITSLLKNDRKLPWLIGSSLPGGWGAAHLRTAREASGPQGAKLERTRVGRRRSGCGAGRGSADAVAHVAPRGPSRPHGPGVPGEAALAVVAPLAHGEHAGVGRAGEEEVAHVEGPQRTEPPALARTAEALQAAPGLGAHAGGAAAARCGARASREGGREGRSAAAAGLQGTRRSAPGGCCAQAAPRSAGREGGARVRRARARESARTRQAALPGEKGWSPKPPRPPPAVPATASPLRSRVVEQGMNECGLQLSCACKKTQFSPPGGLKREFILEPIRGPMARFGLPQSLRSNVVTI